ncbi:hypothetical protein PT274_05340 [Leuconostocaceae bacterium ESL0958]|nr:hypothetical protein [Leuconostocaceae bacterium ESL0958]
MNLKTVSLTDETMTWAKKSADLKGVSVPRMLAELIEEARQDDQDYQAAMSVIRANNRSYVSAEEMKAKYLR